MDVRAAAQRPFEGFEDQECRAFTDCQPVRSAVRRARDTIGECLHRRVLADRSRQEGVDAAREHGIGLVAPERVVGGADRVGAGR